MKLPEAAAEAEVRGRRGVACEEGGEMHAQYLVFQGRCWERDGDVLVPAKPDNGLLMADCWYATDDI